MNIKTLIKKLLRRSSYEPLIEVHLSQSALLHNLHTYQKAYPTVQCAPVLKSNAYGHGLTQVARILAKEKSIPFFVLDSLYEATLLRRHGITTPLLIIGYVEPETLLRTRLTHVSITVTDIEQLRVLRARLRHTIRVHIKIDTGMHRQGISPSDIKETLTILKESKQLILEGVCSHFADADNANGENTQAQIHIWEQAVKQFRNHFSSIPYVHISATAGAPHAIRTEGNLLRLGLGLYGINASRIEPMDLRPVLSMNSRVSSVRTINPGEHVGYNATFTAPEKLTVATVPAGYYEGIDRRLSNIGVLLLNKTPCPIVGRVSMNITTVHVPENTKVGMPITIVSNNESDPNSVVSMARAAHTIPWEILVHIPPHLRRTVVP